MEKGKIQLKKVIVFTDYNDRNIEVYEDINDTFHMFFFKEGSEMAVFNNQEARVDSICVMAALSKNIVSLHSDLEDEVLEVIESFDRSNEVGIFLLQTFKDKIIDFKLTSELLKDTMRQCI